LRLYSSAHTGEEKDLERKREAVFDFHLVRINLARPKTRRWEKVYSDLYGERPLPDYQGSYSVEVTLPDLTKISLFVYFLAGLSVGHSFAYVALFVFFRDVWIRTQRAGVASMRATNLATYLHVAGGSTFIKYISFNTRSYSPPPTPNSTYLPFLCCASSSCLCKLNKKTSYIFVFVIEIFCYTKTFGSSVQLLCFLFYMNEFLTAKKSLVVFL
jgi:hypothetical protein